MSDALNAKQFAPQIREEESPESAVRDIKKEVHTQDASHDFYDELTDPLWSPPLLQPVSPGLDSSPRLDPRCRIDIPPTPQEPSHDFYDELTDPLWSPPLLQPVHPALDPESPLEDPPVPQPPVFSVWRWLWMALTGN